MEVNGDAGRLTLIEKGSKSGTCLGDPPHCLGDGVLPVEELGVEVLQGPTGEIREHNADVAVFPVAKIIHNALFKHRFGVGVEVRQLADEPLELLPLRGGHDLRGFQELCLEVLIDR